MKIKIHKETLYVLSLVLIALGIAISIVANLGTGVYTVPALALSSVIYEAIPSSVPVIKDIFGSQPFSSLMIEFAILVIFCIVIRKFRPFFLLSFLTSFLYNAIMYGIQWIPCFVPEIDHQYPLFLRWILLAISMILISLAVVCALKGYVYTSTITFTQKGVIKHFNIKNTWLVFVIYDFVFMVISVFIIYAIFHTWEFWNYNLSYGTLLNVFLCGPMIQIFSKWFDKLFETKTLFPKLERAFRYFDNEKI